MNWLKNSRIKHVIAALALTSLLGLGLFSFHHMAFSGHKVCGESTQNKECVVPAVDPSTFCLEYTLTMFNKFKQSAPAFYKSVLSLLGLVLFLLVWNIKIWAKKKLQFYNQRKLEEHSEDNYIFRFIKTLGYWLSLLQKVDPVLQFLPR